MGDTIVKNAREMTIQQTAEYNKMVNAMNAMLMPVGNDDYEPCHVTRMLQEMHHPAANRKLTAA